MKRIDIAYIVSCLLLICIICCNDMKSSRKPLLEQKIDSLLKLMTLEEKIGQMTQIIHFEESAEESVTS